MRDYCSANARSFGTSHVPAHVMHDCKPLTKYIIQIFVPRSKIVDPILLHPRLRNETTCYGHFVLKILLHPPWKKWLVIDTIFFIQHVLSKVVYTGVTVVADTATVEESTGTKVYA